MFLRKIVLVVAHVLIILALRQLLLQMSQQLPLNQIQPHHQQPMLFWYWTPSLPATRPWLLISMVRRTFFYIWVTLSLGNINENLDFKLTYHAPAYRGCGATLNGEFWYFGNEKKVSFALEKILNPVLRVNYLYFLSLAK